MTCTDRRLSLALAISLALHILPFVADSLHLRTVPRPPPPLVARLVPPPLPPVPELMVPKAAPEPVPTPPPPAAANPKPTAKPATWKNVVRQQLKQLHASGQFYSREAFAQGLEGDPVVLFVLDEGGNATAAGIQQSSGNPLLDRDAVAAALRLRGLPADAPREVLLPLRFRLKN